MGNILCFGEMLLRLSPVLQGEWLRQNNISIYTGGAELNVAAALANWKLPVTYCSAAPDNFLSREIISYLRQRNIDTSAFHFSGTRIGTYILPQGSDLKHTEVIYDRAGSSFANLRPGMINWEKVLEEISWFHFSAISPAVSDDAADVCEEALKVASAKNITISLDLNYRSKLWQFGKKPIEVMPSLAKYCNVIMGNVWSANTLLGIPVDENIHRRTSKEAYLSYALETSLEIKKRYPKCSSVANTFRFDYKDQGIRYFAALFQDDKQVSSAEYFADTITDKVGTGDCFMAGLIYGLYNHHPTQKTLDFSASAAFGKFFEKGDFTNQNLTTVTERINSNNDVL